MDINIVAIIILLFIVLVLLILGWGNIKTRSLVKFALGVIIVGIVVFIIMVVIRRVFFPFPVL
jgi:hypothetical protein